MSNAVWVCVVEPTKPFIYDVNGKFTIDDLKEIEKEFIEDEDPKKWPIGVVAFRLECDYSNGQACWEYYISAWELRDGRVVAWDESKTNYVLTEKVEASLVRGPKPDYSKPINEGFLSDMIEFGAPKVIVEKLQSADRKITDSIVENLKVTGASKTAIDFAEECLRKQNKVSLFSKIKGLWKNRR